MKKVFVLDTNILIHDPYAFLNFEEHDIVIPMTVLEELDSLKDRKTDVSKDARVAIKALESLMEDKKADDITKGVPIHAANGDSKGQLSVFNDMLGIKGAVLDSKHPDNSIINTAIHIHQQELALSESQRRQVVLVTKDINMRIKAKSAGLDYVEDYKNDQVLTDASLMNKGFIEWAGRLRFWDVFNIIGDIDANNEYSLITVSKQELEDHPVTQGLIYPNTYIIDKNHSSVLRVHSIDDEHVTFKELNYGSFMNKKAWDIKPKCHLQAAALNALLDPTLSMVTVTGGAGSGKTFLSVAAALHMVCEKKMYDKIIVTRSTPDIAEAIGFLPGDETMKMEPWLAAIGDTMEALHKDDADMQSSIRIVTEKANIQYKSINFLRGRNFNRSLILLDEAQNLTSSQLKTIVSRVGEDSKIIVLGNSGQVDVKYLSKLNNGVVIATETFKSFDGAAHISLNGVIRSRLAAFTEANM